LAPNGEIREKSKPPFSICQNTPPNLSLPNPSYTVLQIKACKGVCQQGNIPPPVGGNHFRAEKQDASGIKGPQNEDDHGFQCAISHAIAAIVLDIPGKKVVGHLEEEGADRSSG